MTDHEKRIREALLIAAINCPHEITDNRITLYFNAAKPGHNALNQLSTRIEEANSALLADLDAMRGALKRLYVAAPIGLECSSFHHSKGEFHSHSEPCKPANEYVEAIAQADAALKGATA